MVSMPGGHAAKRVVLEGAGWLLLVLGTAALILPGPGLLETPFETVALVHPCSSVAVPRRKAPGS